MTGLLIFGGVLLAAGVWGFFYFRGHPYDVSADAEQQKALDEHPSQHYAGTTDTPAVGPDDLTKARKARHKI